MEFYLLNYFKPATYEQTGQRRSAAAQRFDAHRLHALPRPEPRRSTRDRRVADVETVYDPQRGIFNRLFATADAAVRRGRRRQRASAAQAAAPRSRSSCATSSPTSSATTSGPDFHERNYDGTLRREFLTDAAVGRGQQRRPTATTAAAST